ncbi:membrane lipoprotein lipid attachment site-containing protein [bacterium]|nr:membrane lipoprotein lipid attachment site-containing protein [bacterium]
MKKIAIFFVLLLLLSACTIGDDKNSTNIICSEENPNGECPDGQVCNYGLCESEKKICSNEYPTGECSDSNLVCENGVCVQKICSINYPNGVCPTNEICNNGVCEASVCSTEFPNGKCPENYSCNGGVCIYQEYECSIEHPNGVCSSGFHCENGNCVEDLIDMGEFNSFSGKWAQLFHFESNTVVFGINTFSTTKTYILLTAEQIGNRVNVSAKVCDIDVKNGQNGIAPVQIIIPDAFINSLENSTAQYTLTKNGADINVYQPEKIDYRGVRLTDPENEELPESSEDSRVFDQDSDGFPGMTMISTGLISSKIYMIQRTRTTLNGKITSKDSFDGNVTWYDEQNVLGAESSLLDQDMDIEPDNENSKFFTTRVDSGWGCTDIIDNKDTLFSRE